STGETVKEVEEREGPVSRIAWKIRPNETLKLNSVRILDGRFVSLISGHNQRLLAMMRVRLSDTQDEAKLDYAATMRIALQQQRMKGLFDGLYRAEIPFLYVSMMVPSPDDRLEAEVFEFDLVVGTWVDSKVKEAETALQELEQRANVLAATTTVALPSAQVRRLSRNELRDFVKSLFLPNDVDLPQVGSASVVSTLESFESRSPMAGTVDQAAQFYVPNAAESGKSGILLGKVKSSGGEFHDFFFQLDDLKRHVAILGMTGSGKSTTAATIVKQVAEMGLSALVLDWHNEYGAVISRAGGQVVSPGKDDFAINPIESPYASDPVEHIAMVTDIFSDIYHFTHPQAFMFRNALQKRVTESSEQEVPSLASLVRTIEAYPLRSAYDNETKVALLRRLVPLTQGQAGRALDGPGTSSMDDLMGKVVCVELGHLRDTQTRGIFTDIMLKILYEYRLKRQSGLEHLTVVEEARNVVPARRAEDPPSVGERMISELRKFGEAMLFVAQFPTQVSSEVIKNSGARIVHRVAWPEDISLLGDSLGLSREQREFVGRLQVGEGVVSLSRLQRPILVQVRGDAVIHSESRDLSFAAEA
ncbi:MAG: ATP-binding protein, partial [Nitrososphaerota archaeon]|nr:ATP-binding protein [Nitrososphaerota archaeon]